MAMWGNGVFAQEAGPMHDEEDYAMQEAPLDPRALAGITTIFGFITQPLYHFELDQYQEWPQEGESGINWFNYTIGVTYRF